VTNNFLGGVNLASKQKLTHCGKHVEKHVVDGQDSKQGSHQFLTCCKDNSHLFYFLQESKDFQKSYWDDKFKDFHSVDYWKDRVSSVYAKLDCSH